MCVARWIIETQTTVTKPLDCLFKLWVGIASNVLYTLWFVRPSHNVPCNHKRKVILMGQVWRKGCTVEQYQWNTTRRLFFYPIEKEETINFSHSPQNLELCCFELQCNATCKVESRDTLHQPRSVYHSAGIRKPCTVVSTLLGLIPLRSCPEL